MNSQETCDHKNKVYDESRSIVYCCMPPIIERFWVCENCGEEGTTERREVVVNRYDETKARFGKVEG